MSEQGYTDGGPNPDYVGDCKYCALKADKIAALQKQLQGTELSHDIGDEIMDDYETQIATLQAKVTELEAENRVWKLRWEGIKDSCAGDCAAMVINDIAAMPQPPSKEPT